MERCQKHYLTVYPLVLTHKYNSNKVSKYPDWFRWNYVFGSHAEKDEICAYNSINDDIE
jgi:hypothetical protein